VIPKQLTASELKVIDSAVKKILRKQMGDVSTSFQEFLASQQTLQDTQSETALSLARDELVDVYGQQISNFNELLANSIKTKMTPILRKMRTQINTQTKRETQIDKLFQTTRDKIRAAVKPVVARRAKTVREKLDQDLEAIFQNFRTQLEKQTNREAKLEEIFGSTTAKLAAVPEAAFSKVSVEKLDEQVAKLVAIFGEYQSALERQHLTNTKSITAEFQSLLQQVPAASFADSMKSQLDSLLKKSCTEVLESYRIQIAAEQANLEKQAETAYQTALDKQLRSQLRPRLREYSASQSPPINTSIDEAKALLAETVKKTDTNNRTLIEKYWLPLTKIIDEYSAGVVANLTALNTATGTAVDQTTANVNTSLTNFEDDSNRLLTATIQTFDREKSGINEQITHGFTEMQEDCIAQLQEAHTLLETLGSEITTQRTAINEKMETMVEEIDTTTVSNSAVIRGAANSFVENVQTELQTQEERVENLRKNVQDLIHKQGIALNEGVDRIQTQLVEFSETQIPKTKGIIEEISQTTIDRVDEHRTTINQNLDSFALTLSKELDEYTSTLEQELVQLQTVTSKLVEKIGDATNTLDTDLGKETETSKINLLTSIDAQQTALNRDATTVFKSLGDSSQAAQLILKDNLNRITEEGKDELDQNQTEISTTLDNTLDATFVKSEKSIQSQLEFLNSKTQSLITQLAENLSTIGNRVTTSSDRLLKAVNSTLTNSKTELAKLFSSSKTLIEEEELALQTEISQEAEKALQNQTKAVSLTETRLKRATQDSIRRTNESLQGFKGITSTDLQQKSKTIVATINQVFDNAKDSLVTQTQQTGRRISRTLSKERQALKTEYQTLAKEITTRAKNAETTAVNSLQLFSAQTEPTLDRLRTQAGHTEEILIGLWETLTKLEPAEAERTWRIVTCEGIQNHLLDMFHRVDETITLVYPSFDEVPVTELSKVQPKSRVHIITTLNGEKERTNAQKLLQQGNIRIWDNPNMEFYGGSRDGEEVLIAPTYGNQGEIVAVVSDQASYIALFNQTLGPRWISSSNEIRP
jgi:hypothetical protein